MKDTLRLFWTFTKPNKRYFWLGTIGAGLGVIVQEILPTLIIAQAFNILQDLARTGESFEFSRFTPYVIAYFVTVTLGFIVWRSQIWFVWKYEVAAIESIASHIFNHLQRLGERFHADNFGGSLVSQATKFIRAYERTMDEFTWSVVTSIVAYVASFSILVITSPLYAAVFFVLSVVYFVITFLRAKLSLPRDRALATSESNRTGKLADMITNVSTVRSYASEKYELKHFKKSARDTTNKYFELLRVVWTNEAISHLINNTIAFSAFFVGIYAVTELNADAGVLFLTVSYTMALSRRLRDSARTFRNLNRALGDAQDMTGILHTKPEIEDTKDATKLVARRGEITFQNVFFAYEDNASNLFSDLNIRIKPGEKIGLVGHSGGGKTTITKLLQRTLEIQKGVIAIDRQDISQVTQSSLRAAIANVPQEPLLFHRSIFENIAYGRKGASYEEVQAVAKMAHADEFIDQLHKGYDTLVGERGVKLSGGQRQRIAIARAMLKNAPILVLDEATSALDSESEALIQDALWKLMENRTAIVIAHRLSTIQKMDRILVMEQGEIVEQGTHNELIRSKGIYADLWNHQSGGFLEE
jgi:ATP-binding cassette, subfamily B, bacterial